MRRITIRLGDYVEEQKRRDRRAGRIVAVLAIGAALVIAMSATDTTSTTGTGTSTGPAHLATSAAALQFAPQLAGTASTAQLLRLHNDGGAPLTIAKIAADNDAFRIANDCATLAPNESCSAAVVFAPSAAGAQHGNVTVQTDGGAATVNVDGEGRAIPTVDLGPTDFGNTPLGTAAERSIRFMNSGATAIALGKSSVDAPFTIAADTCSGAIAAGVNCEVRVQFQPAAAGNATGELRLAGANGAVVAKGALLGAGDEAPPPPAKPAHLVTSPAALTLPAETRVTVKNDGDEPLLIQSIAAEGPFRVTHDCGQALAGNATCSVVVELPMLRMASFRTTKGALVITTNGGAATIPIAAEVRPLPTVQLPLTDFGRAFPNTAVERTVHFTNSAATMIGIAKATVPAPFEIARDGCAQQKLAPGGGCDVQLRFRPAAGVVANGELQIVDVSGIVVARGELRGIGLRQRPLTGITQRVVPKP